MSTDQPGRFADEAASDAATSVDADPDEARRAAFAETLRAYAETPEGKAKAERYRSITEAVRQQEARQAEVGRTLVNARESMIAAQRAEKDQEEARHRELVDAMQKAGEHSWRRDIAIAAIGAAFGVAGTVVVSLLTGIH